MVVCKEDSLVDGNTDAVLEYRWRRRFGGTSGTTKIPNTFNNTVCVCLKPVCGN